MSGMGSQDKNITLQIHIYAAVEMSGPSTVLNSSESLNLQSASLTVLSVLNPRVRFATQFTSNLAVRTCSAANGQMFHVSATMFHVRYPI